MATGSPALEVNVYRHVSSNFSLSAMLSKACEYYNCVFFAPPLPLLLYFLIAIGLSLHFACMRIKGNETLYIYNGRYLAGIRLIS